ncbi:hypothetical protein MPC1_490007 [Methylocella tundrae]|nr:hypothetical protein MPC1_490007 [Methylocella tundrae]
MMASRMGSRISAPAFCPVVARGAPPENLPPLSQSRPAAPAGFRRSSPRTAAVLSSPPPDRQIPASRRWTTAGKLLYKTPLVSGPPRDAQVAQLVEHATENRSVGGSIPPLGTTLSSGCVDNWPDIIENIWILSALVSRIAFARPLTSA